MKRIRHGSALFGTPIVALLALVACAQAPTAESFKPHTEALYEQCAALSKAKSKPAAEADIAALGSPDAAKRVAAAGRLAGACDSHAVAPLLKMLKEDKDIPARAAAAIALGKLGDQEAIDPLREAIADPAWQVRLEVGRSLCSFQVHRGSYDVLNVLVNPQATTVNDLGDLYARCQSILAINQLRDVNFSRKALHFLFYFPDLPVGTNAAYRDLANATLAELKNTRNGPHEFVGILKQNLNPVFRVRAAEWIGRLGIMSGEEALTDAAENDLDRHVRDAAAKALGQLKQAQSKP
jgi:HEAT repeat protein